MDRSVRVVHMAARRWRIDNGASAEAVVDALVQLFDEVASTPAAVLRPQFDIWQMLALDDIVGWWSKTTLATKECSA